MTSTSSVAVVLLNYNGLELLQQHLPFLKRLTYSNYRLFVIDNHSTDASVSYLKTQHPDIGVIAFSENKGYARGYNEGLQQIPADYFILLNTDVEVDAGFIEPMLDLLQQNPVIGICQPKILSLQRRNMFEYAGSAGGFMDKYGYTFARGRILSTIETDQGQYDTDIPVFWAGGACLMIETALFHQLGGFYNDFFMYSEEVDLCWRAQLAGREVWVSHRSVVYHHETTDFMSQKNSRIYYVFRNNLIMLLNNLPLRDKMIVVPIRILLNVLAAFLFLIKGHFAKFFLVLKSIPAALLVSKSPVTPPDLKKQSLHKLPAVYNGSIIAAYYLKRCTRFSGLSQRLAGKPPVG